MPVFELMHMRQTCVSSENNFFLFQSTEVTEEINERAHQSPQLGLRFGVASLSVGIEEPQATVPSGSLSLM